MRGRWSKRSALGPGEGSDLGKVGLGWPVGAAGEIKFPGWGVTGVILAALHAAVTKTNHRPAARVKSLP
jgi:hypothetical protein